MMAVLLNRWFILAAVTAAFAAALFGRDLLEQSTDAARGILASADDRASGIAPDLFKASVRSGFARNDPAQVAVSDVKVDSHAASQVILSARLVSSVPGNDYPNLVVDLKATDGKSIRSVELLPTQYEHAAALTDEHVRFTVELRAGEARVAAHASYPVPAP